MESRHKAPIKPVHVVFQKVYESDEKVVCPTMSENYEPDAMLIVVKFVEPKKL